MLSKGRTRTTMHRPLALPNFDAPPLSEVVVGIQYERAPWFSAVNYSDIYELFREEYPEVQEHPPIEPRIETFGGGQNTSKVSLTFGPPPLHPRLWLTSHSHDHLLQFQNDRLLLNWKKSGDVHTYPQFESVLVKFEEALEKLNEFWSTTSQLLVTQAEVSYINIIPVDNFAETSKWLKIGAPENEEMDSITINFERALADAENKPFARVFYELVSVVEQRTRGKALRLTITVRGDPAGSDRESIQAFFLKGRRHIVELFDRLSTDFAKENWKKHAT